MLYPDGSVVAIGDLIWWNEGASVGYVHAIVESRDEQKSWGLDEPGFLVGDSHPFDLSEGWVMYSPSDMEDEGIAKLSEAEREEFARVSEIACQQSVVGFEARKYRVLTPAENCQMVEWIFSLQENGVEIERHVVPVRPESILPHTPV